MRRTPAFAVLALIALCAAPPALAEVNVSGAVVGSFPVGAFAEKDNIIRPAPYGWSVTGGGAGTGLGFGLEVETRVGRVTWIGFRFGYAKYGADAAALMEYINSIPDTSGTSDEITALDGSWTTTFMSFPARFVARDFGSGSTYLKAEIGWVKVGSAYEGTVVTGDPPSERPAGAEFAYGNQFFFSAGLGVDFRSGPSFAIVAEVKYTRVFSAGAETASAIAGKSVRSGLSFDLKSVDLAVGVRIPVGGI